MLRFAAGLACVAALSLPQAASAWTSRNGLSVNPVNDVVFEVVGRNNANGPDFWCAASEYANAQLGAAWTARMYIARTRGQSVTTNRRSAVHFTLNPDKAGVTPIDPQPLINQLREGDNMTVQGAQGQCQLRNFRF